jgi:fatty acid desaturase
MAAFVHMHERSQRRDIFFARGSASNTAVAVNRDILERLSGGLDVYRCRDPCRNESHIMSLEILRDPRIRRIGWRDLVPLSRLEVLKELGLSLPWFALSLYLAHVGWYLPALAASFVFFLTGLRQVHNAYHYALGLSRAPTEWVMFALSVLMLGSMHAIQLNHLRHHRHCMNDDDVESMGARMSGLGAILIGPLFPFCMHWKAFQLANRRQLRWIAVELLANAAILILVFLVLDVPALRYHFLVMMIGHCLTAFFAVWTVHHDCDRSHFIARTLRGPIKNFLSFSMFFHVEHHLYPNVPTCHLARLAARLDQVAPELQQKQVF